MLDYVKYIEHSEENLQFYLWYKSYEARFELLSSSEKILVPEWTPAHVNADAHTTGQFRASNPIAAFVKDAFEGKTQPTVSVQRVDPFNTPPKPSSFTDESKELDSDSSTSLSTDARSCVKQNAEQAFHDAGMHWKPCKELSEQSDCPVFDTNPQAIVTTQPFRDEITRIIGTYLAEGGARELNISSRERRAAMHALQHTTHPSALKQIVSTVEYSLRKQTHPNFIRWTIGNANPPRVLFARGLGVALISFALVANVLLTLSGASRAWRVLPLVGWLLGISTLFAAMKGMCVVLHGLHHRNLRPWELFTDDNESFADEDYVTPKCVSSGSRSSSESAPWVTPYKKRNIIRKIFDRQTWIQEPALRQIQDTIFLQSLLTGLLIGGVAVGIFCAIPAGNYF
jgi:hypothetical protein